MIHKEQLVSEKKIHQGKIISGYERVYLDQEGEPVRVDVYEHPGGVCVAATPGQQKYFLVRQYRYGVDDILWEYPAGKLDGTEDPFVAAQRELGEEIGKSADQWDDLGMIYLTPGYVNEKIWFYEAWSLSNVTQHLDAHEYMDVQLFTLPELASMIESGDITDAKTIALTCKLLLKYRNA